MVAGQGEAAGEPVCKPRIGIDVIDNEVIGRESKRKPPSNRKEGRAEDLRMLRDQLPVSRGKHVAQPF
jgi:hypothetical protein